MKYKFIQLVVLIFLLLSISVSCKKKEIEENNDIGTKLEVFDSIQLFDAPDGVQIRADLYMPHSKDSTFIILFHQAGWSRGEYMEIAPKLNKMGFNCMAVDQRSGGIVNGVENITNKNALSKGKKTTYVDAEQDMLAAIAHAKSKFVNKKVIIWGSSYSSALVLRIMGENPDIADASLSFSPGEYFVQFGKPSNYIQTSTSKITKPVFITSARNEEGSWKSIYLSVKSKGKMSFLPLTKGNHGSRALWSKFYDNEAYWTATTEFLNLNR